MRHASLFSGIGGFDLAAEWMGWENVFNCEIDPFCQKVLKYHFPNAIQLGDIKKLKFKRDDRGNVWIRRDGILEERTPENPDSGRGCWKEGIRESNSSGVQGQEQNNNAHKTGNGYIRETAEENFEETQWQNIGPVDILSGGFPCQPFSMAGKRRGTDDDRHLWPEYMRLIREIRPTWVLGENVAGILTMALSKGDVKVEGKTIVRNEDEDIYSGVYTQQERMLLESICQELESEGYEVQPFIIPACGVGAPHRRDRCWIVAHRSTRDTQSRDAPSQVKCECTFKGRENTSTGVACGQDICTGIGETRDILCGNIQAIQDGLTPNATMQRAGIGLRGDGTIAYANDIRSGEQNESEKQPWRTEIGRTGEDVICQNGAAADTELHGHDGNTIEERQQSGRRGTAWSEPTSPCNRRTTWDDFPTQPPLRSRNDEFPGGLDGITVSKLRNESIKAAGNAVVPVLVYEIFQAIQKYEEQYK